MAVEICLPLRALACADATTPRARRRRRLGFQVSVALRCAGSLETCRSGAGGRVGSRMLTRNGDVRCRVACGVRRAEGRTGEASGEPSTGQRVRHFDCARRVQDAVQRHGVVRRIGCGCRKAKRGGASIAAPGSSCSRDRRRRSYRLDRDHVRRSGGRMPSSASDEVAVRTVARDRGVLSVYDKVSG